MEIPNMFEAKQQVQWLRRILLLLSLAIGIYSYTAYASRVSDKIYSKLQNGYHCSRRLNATHQMGCQSDLGGNLGIIWLVEDSADLNHLLKTGDTPPYVAVLKRDYYTRENLLKFKEHLNRIAGVVFLNDDSRSRTIPFSPEYTCPNKYSGLYVNDTQYQDCKTNQWQKESQISGLLYDDIPYPIFLINEKKSIDEIESCFHNHNVLEGIPKTQADYPLCGIQLDSFMLAASNTKSCLNSRSLVSEIIQPNNQRCATIENYNIFAFYKPAVAPLLPMKDNPKKKKPDTAGLKSIVLLLAKLSSLSMFSDLSPGADSTVTSIITLLAVAEALNKIRNSTVVSKSNRNIAFALLDSEPFDYTGSSSMIYSMEKNMFPNPYFKSENVTLAMQNFNLTSLDYVINLDQLSIYPHSNEIHLHSDPNNKNNQKLEKAVEVMKKVAVRESIKFIQDDPMLPLPPTSVQGFIKQSLSLPSSDRLLGFVISNYGKQYNNLFYNSLYDDSHNIYQTSKESLVKHLTKVAQFVAKTLYELTFMDEKTDMITVDKVLIDNMLDCYLVDANCHLFTRAWLAGQQLPAGSIQTYKDPTKPSDDMNGAITRNLLAYFVGDKRGDLNMTQCYDENVRSLEFNYEYVNGKDEPIRDGTSGVCIVSQVLMRSAQSPAYNVTEEGILVDVKYPAWAISYNSIRNPLRLYLKPSPLHQWSIFSMGVLVTIFSFIVVHYINQHQGKLAQPVGTST